MRRLKWQAVVVALAVGCSLMAPSVDGYYGSDRGSGQGTAVAGYPIVINTWRFREACQRAWATLNQPGKTALDAVEQGCAECETRQCDFTVGYGGSPDEAGETTLDAMIMWGPTHEAGAVAGLRRVKSAISVARRVLENTRHTLLSGDLATKFAVQMGFREENLSTTFSQNTWQSWLNNNCQPNFWKNVSPDPSRSCGPYRPSNVLPTDENSVYYYRNRRTRASSPWVQSPASSHDTIGMVAVDAAGQIAAGTSTNGALHKIPGRVGDSPIVGAGSYCDQEVGGAAATGDGDIMMTTLPSYQAVENMRLGMCPADAANDALRRIIRKHPQFSGAIIALSVNGTHGAACHGLQSQTFTYMLGSRQTNVSEVTVTCI